MMQLATALEDWRLREGEYGSSTGDRWGAFIAPGPCGERLMIIAHDGDDPRPELAGWEHVSVSKRRHVPNWIEMCFVKSLFWPPEDAVMQLHPPESSYVNNHPNCLHLWRPTRGVIPLPPSILVGIKELGTFR